MVKIYVFGASGSGTTTLGKKLSLELAIEHFDADDFFWKQTEIPFTQRYSYRHMNQALAARLKERNSWVLSGCVNSWGDQVVSGSDLFILCKAPTKLRIKRLKQREYEKFGLRILPGGDMYENHQRFIAWAAQYEEGLQKGRNARIHDKFVDQLSTEALILDSSKPLDKLLDKCLERINDLKKAA